LIAPTASSFNAQQATISAHASPVPCVRTITHAAADQILGSSWSRRRAPTSSRISRRERSSSGTARASWPCGVRSMRDAGSLPA